MDILAVKHKTNFGKPDYIVAHYQWVAITNKSLFQFRSQRAR
ncbi:hypothetical protein SPHINGOT1_80161 [Sphingomonas sp. T1]|nr:hypothetical protein SPHINGOT1_80161 [Sphingomonas sp. T1]